MELHYEHSDIRSSGDLVADEGTIAASAHAFNVLSKGLYSDAHKAIVRELSCNAWDSHVEAGNTEKPFEVCLPNALAPVFKIRDYGVGLSEQSMFKVYKDYFVSTKQKSNNMTGCFGLGAKSPFAYTEKFTIISFFNGLRIHYIYVKNERGIPQLIKMAESQTEEPNGVEVSFAVESDDFWLFHSAAKTALKPFALRPTIRGLSSRDLENFFPPEPEKDLSGKGWYLRASTADHRYHHAPRGNPIAVMGNVEYPIQNAKKGFSKNASKLLSMDLVIEFPIGSFEITPSRETIQWTDFSVNNINDRLEEIYEEILLLVEQQVCNAPNYWEASIRAHELTHKSQLYVLELHPKWNGLELGRSKEVPRGFILTKYSATYPRHDNMGNSKYPNAVSRSPHGITSPHRTEWYFADYQGAIHRLEHHIRHDVPRDYSVMVIQTVTYVTKKDKLTGKDYEATILNYAPDTLDKFCNTMGFDRSEIKNISSIPNKGRTVPARRSRLAGSKAHAYKFKTTAGGHANDLYWDESDVDLASVKQGVYVEISRWELQNSKVARRGAEFRAAWEHLSVMGIKIPDPGLIGVKTSDMPKFQKASNWMLLDDFLAQELKALWNKSTEFQFAYRMLKKTEKNSNYFRSITEYVRRGTGGSLKWSTKFHEIIKKLESVHSHAGAVARFDTFQGLIADDVRKELRASDQAVDSLVEDMTERYPLLPMLFDGNRYHHYNRAAIAQYTQLIDKEVI